MLRTAHTRPPATALATSAQKVASALGLVFVMTCAGCAKDAKEALQVPEKAHSAPIPEQETLGRLVKAYPATVANALAGLTRAPLTVNVGRAQLGQRFAWLEVSDDTGSAWAITPPLAVTPTGQVALSGWVRQRVTLPATLASTPASPSPTPLPSEATTVMVLWTSHISGATVTAVENGEEAVLDPVFAAMELTGTVAQSAPPRIRPADHTIAALHMDKTRLEGKTVKIRGQVIHVIADLSGRTWWLLRDGATEDDPFASGGTNVLLVAASQPIALGEVVLVAGAVVLDRAFTLTSPIPLMLMPSQRLEEAPTDGAAAPAAAPATDTHDNAAAPAHPAHAPAPGAR